MKNLFIALCALAIVIPVKAAEFDLYGRIAPAIWFNKTERFYDDSIGTDSITGETLIGNDSVPLYYCTLWPYGNIGFKYKGDKFGAVLEVEIRQAMYESTIYTEGPPQLFVNEHLAVAAKKFYAEWFVTDWMTVLVGKSAAPACFFTSNQLLYNSNGFSNTGCLWTGSVPMIQIALGNDFPFGLSWEYKVAAIRVDTGAVGYQNTSNVFTETRFPKFENSINLNFEKNFFAVNLECGGGYQQYVLSTRLTNVSADSNKTPVDCYVIGVDFGLKFWAVKVSYNWAMGQNVGAYGADIGNPFIWRGVGLSYLVDIYYPYHENKNNEWKIANGKAVEMAGIINVKPLEWFSVEGGFGYVHADHEYPKLKGYWHDIYAYYGSLQFKVANILDISPEFGQYLYGKTYGHGRFTYWGIELGIGF